MLFHTFSSSLFVFRESYKLFLLTRNIREVRHEALDLFCNRSSCNSMPFALITNFMKSASPRSHLLPCEQVSPFEEYDEAFA